MRLKTGTMGRARPTLSLDTGYISIINIFWTWIV